MLPTFFWGFTFCVCSCPLSSQTQNNTLCLDKLLTNTRKWQIMMTHASHYLKALLSLWISLLDHGRMFWCKEIYRDSQFLIMAPKAEWLTQNDLCDYGKSVRLYCLPGAIVPTNPQLIKPNWAFCLTVKPPPPFQSQTKGNNSPVEHHCFVKIQRCCPTQLSCFHLSAFCFVPHLICFPINEMVC